MSWLISQFAKVYYFSAISQDGILLSWSGPYVLHTVEPAALMTG